MRRFYSSCFPFICKLNIQQDSGNQSIIYSFVQEETANQNTADRNLYRLDGSQCLTPWTFTFSD